MTKVQLLIDLSSHWWFDSFVGSLVPVSILENGDKIYYQRVREVQGKTQGIGVFDYQDIYISVTNEELPNEAAYYRDGEPNAKSDYDDCVLALKNLESIGTFYYYKILDRSVAENSIIFSAVTLINGSFVSNIYSGVFSGGNFTYTQVSLS